MANPTIKIVNAKTGEAIEREMNGEELAIWEADSLAQEAIRQAEAEKQAKLESAKAKLTALGLDEAEVQAILGL